ncbi:hypothetical protein HUT16_18420 [Kitasatospora sp. NA04385]|uniref:endonuclease/exonuclease/phosphatase family protein n=1 Tax=Kitasatospora sp. NA04385 TaxID=2742135 RepID=UPI0015906F07|nr:endonuclease/exonuclease/phosphatase family protein [Kitasatospora sp. NA04385]QKW20780.1 hypothetical protein HUT16_18420 [Kitasatospora sp. NA04385]
MSMEAALLESRTLRSGLCERTEALDEVKALVLLPDGLYVTTRMVADYFEVGEDVVRQLVRRNRKELESNGYFIHKPVENPAGQSDKMSLWQVSGHEGGEGAPPADNPYGRPQGGGNGVALYSRRAVLNVAMLLRDSEVARRVRGRLLDAVEAAARPVVRPPVVHAFRGRPWRRWSELRWDEYEAERRDPAVAAWRRRIDGLEPFGAYRPGEDGPAVPYAGEPEPGFTAADLPALVAGLVVSVGSIERRLEAQGVLITAIGERISRQEARIDAVEARCDALAEDARAIRRDVAHLRRRHRR